MARESLFSRLVRICALFIGAILVATPGHAAVGRTVGSFNVSNIGSASYAISIFVPPAPRGMQPSVALVYNSNGGAGYVGKGWTLAGFSSISRCNKTIEQDGAASPARLLYLDAYCLDGNRLRLQNSPSWNLNGSTWATEIADFSLITASGTTEYEYSPGGPSSWTVKRKDGTIFTYGGTEDSRVLANSSNTAVRTWLVSKIEDRHGNTILFEYESPDSNTSGITHPESISWTQTSAGSGTYLYTMEFSYGANVPASSNTGYAEGNEVFDKDLLSTIEVKKSGSTVRQYILDYGTSPTTGAKRLEEVKECAASTSDCLSPTEIEYQDGQVGFATTHSSSYSFTGGIYEANGQYDFNGDGLQDVIYRRDGAWYVRFASITGYGSEYATGCNEFSLMAGDPFGTGRDVLMGFNGTTTWYAFRWNGSSFATISTGLDYSDTAEVLALVDVDGDGKDDMVYTPPVIYTGLGIDMKTRPSTSSGSTLSFGSEVTSTYMPYVPDGATLGTVGPYVKAAAGRVDANGDGRQDPIVGALIGYCWIEYGCWEYWYHATVLAEDDYGYREFSSSLDDNVYYPADINSDNCSDAGGYSSVVSSDCDGGNATSTGTAGLVQAMVDWDGDGRRDALIYRSGYSTLYIQRSTGDGIASPEDTGLPTGCYWFVTDANADGQEDLGCYNGSYVRVYLHNGAGVKPDLAVSFKDGYEVATEVSYVVSTHEAYTPPTDAAYPQRNFNRPLTLAHVVTAMDGVGGEYTTTYSYAGGWENLLGRGFLGFYQVEAEDSRNDVKRVRRFQRPFPFTGMLIEETLYQPTSSGGYPIKSTTATPAVDYTIASTAYNQRYFPHADSTAEETYEVGGSRNGYLVTRVDTSYTYDSANEGWGNLTEIERVVTDKDTTSPLYNKTWTQTTTIDFASDPDRETHWCIGLPTEVEVLYATSNGENGVTRTKSYLPDYENCRMDEEVIEPGGGNRKVKIEYGYDDFGNVEDVDVTGRNETNTTDLAVRNTHTEWGVTGQFPVSETNALSQTTTRTFHSTFGSLLTETDPNSIVVTDNTYDTFGRLQTSERADDTSTHYIYRDCAYFDCRNGDPSSGVTSINKMAIEVQHRNSSGTPYAYDITFTDQLDRSIVQLSMGLSGDYVRVGRQYDAFGRLLREHAPIANGTFSTFWTTNTYDLLGRVTQQTRPRSDSDVTPVTTTFTYAGRTQTVTDPNSKTSTKILDVNGWMRRSTDHDGYYQSFNYDAAGSLVGVTDSLSNVLFGATYAYGAGPFQTATTDMDLGSWTYTHNSLGEQVAWTDANGRNFSQTFDALSRVLTRSDHQTGETEGTTIWTYGTSAGSKNIGRVASVSLSNADYSEAFSYDSVGRPITRSIAIDGSTYNFDTTYNNQGLPDTLTYPTSTSSTRVKVKYGYAYGILQSVTDWTSGSAGTVYWTANTQNVRGQTTQETLGNGVVTNRTFDAVTGWLNTIQSGVSGGTGLQNQSYLYDKIGNVTQRQENTLGLTENFYYDNLYRLDYSQLGGVTNLDLTYDAMGNITARSDVNGGNTWAYHGTKKHAVANTGSGGATYTYDNNGNMTSRDGQTIRWASFNYPAYVSTATENATFLYGPDRQYYRQEYNGPSSSETTYYVGGLLEKVCPSLSCSSGTIDWRHYIVAEGQTVAIVSRKSTGTNSVSYPLEDHLGSLTEFANSSGTLSARQSFEAFGSRRDGSDWDGLVSTGDLTNIEGLSSRGYTGHSMLHSMGLIHMNGRVQDSTTGRFLSPDPYVFEPGLTQGYNRYAYVHNNPLTHVDPSGFDTVWRCNFVPKMDWEHDFEITPYTFLGQRVLIATGVSRHIPAQGWDKICFYEEVSDANYSSNGSGPNAGSSQTDTTKEKEQQKPQEQKLPEYCTRSVNGKPSPVVAAAVTEVDLRISSVGASGPAGPLAAYLSVAAQRAYQLYPGNDWDPRDAAAGNRIYGAVTSALGLSRGFSMWMSGVVEQFGRESNSPYDRSNGTAIPPSGNYGNSLQAIQQIDEGRGCAN